MATEELSNDERLDAQRKLAELNTAGQLSPEQYRRINAAIWQVEDRDELNQLISSANDSSPTYALVPQQNRAPVHDSFASSTNQLERALLPGERAIPASVGFWGATERVGRWAAGRNHVSVAVMGGTVLDLREAAFEGVDVDVTCVAFWGGTDIIVPPQMQVRVTGVGVLGSFGWENGRQATAQGEDPNLPTLTVSGLALMGAVEIHRLDYGVPFEDD